MAKTCLEILVPHRPDRCQTCRFWSMMWDGHRGISDPLDNTDEPWGYCMRYPPHRPTLGIQERIDHHGFNRPITAPYDWCGEWADSDAE